MRIARRLVDAQDEYDGAFRSARHLCANYSCCFVRVCACCLPLTACCMLLLLMMMSACRLRSFAHTDDKFFSRKNPSGRLRATPMLVVLICIELSDVLFAVDSIPAVVGITQDPFIVYSSNIFALMALRSLYLILSKSVQQLLYLKQAVAAILGAQRVAAPPTSAQQR